MKLLWIVLATIAMTGVAAAQPAKKLIVLQSEGAADATTRATVDTAVVALASAGGDQVTPGEINFSDAAALVGCNAAETSCKTQVIDSLGVDEIVITTVTPKPTGFEVVVTRVGKDGAARQATAMVTADGAGKLDAIAPLFTSATIGPTPPVPEPPPTGPAPDPTTTTTDPTTTPPTTTPPTTTSTTPTTTTTTAKPLEQPAGSVDYERRRNRLRIAGMASGGGMVLLSFIFWGAASSVEGDIEDFQVRSGNDLQRLRELEDKGDTYAGLGNLFFVGGLALGGVSTYYYFKARRKRAKATARLVPMVFDGGGGIALTFGGAP